MEPTIIISVFGTLTMGAIFWGGYNLGSIKTRLGNHDQWLKNIDSNVEQIKKDIHKLSK